MYTNIQWIGIADRLMTICPYRLFEYRFIFNPRMWHFCSFIRGMKENARIKYTFEDYRILDEVSGWSSQWLVLMIIDQCKGRVPVHYIVLAIFEIYRIRTKSFDERKLLYSCPHGRTLFIGLFIHKHLFRCAQ